MQCFAEQQPLGLGRPRHACSCLPPPAASRHVRCGECRAQRERPVRRSPALCGVGLIRSAPRSTADAPTSTLRARQSARSTQRETRESATATRLDLWPVTRFDAPARAMIAPGGPLAFSGWFCSACGRVSGDAPFPLALSAADSLSCLQAHTREETGAPCSRSQMSARQEPPPRGLIVFAESVSEALQGQVLAASLLCDSAAPTLTQHHACRRDMHTYTPARERAAAALSRCAQKAGRGRAQLHKWLPSCWAPLTAWP